MITPRFATALEVLFSAARPANRARRDPQAGLAVLAREPIDVVIQDMNFRADTTSGEDGVALFRAIRARQPELPVILLTAWTQLASAVELVKAGAADYLAKPWDDDKLLTTVQNLLELSRPGASSRAGALTRPAGAPSSSKATICAARCSRIRRWSA